VLPEIRGEIAEAPVAERLCGADDRGRIDSVPPRQLPRREEAGFLGILQNGLHEAAAAVVQVPFGARDSELERGLTVGVHERFGGFLGCNK